MIKNIFKLSIFLLIMFLAVVPVNAQESTVNVYFFWGQGCPHCEHEKPFLEKMEDKYSTVEVYEYEVWNNTVNRNYLIEIGKNLNKDISGVPFTVVGDEAYVGYSESLTSKKIEQRINYCLSNNCPDSVAQIVGADVTEDQQVEPQQPIEDEQEMLVEQEDNREQTGTDEKVMPDKISVPVIGEIYTKDLSLPAFAIVLGALDGFNPCAMWTLLFLISLLLGMKDKKRRWILGTAFIAASAFVYFLFMAAWLNLILFIGFIVWIRILIGLIAIGGGGYNLREFFTNKDSGCKVTGGERRQAVFEKLKKITHEKRFAIALIGIILLAFAVNLVELICSAGLPVVFTQVLALSDLSQWQYFGYMLLYIFVFMMDDLFVFFTAMITLEMTGLSTKYTRASHLIGGILMIIIGLLLIFKPEFLMFG